MRGNKIFPTVSIIVLTRDGGELIEKCLNSLLSQIYPNDRFEVILVGSDREDTMGLAKRFSIKVMGADLKPGAKRNFAVKEAKGEILAFCDDDVVAQPNWLSNLISPLVDPKVAVSGGPNLTPDNAGLEERCSGYIFSSPIGSAAMATRYLPDGYSTKDAKETDLISCNMAVKKPVLEAVGGFPEDLWPGEENVFLHQVKKRGYRLVYVPNAIVQHRRRPVFLEHALQVFRYGSGRGRMIRENPDTARALFLLPSVFVLFLLVAGFLSVYMNGLALTAFLIAGTSYVAVVVSESLRIAVRRKDLCAFLLLPLAFFLHHCAYGLGFLKGFVMWK